MVLVATIQGKQMMKTDDFAKDLIIAVWVSLLLGIIIGIGVGFAIWR